MMQRTKSNNSLSAQVKKHANSPPKQKEEYEGSSQIISTGSTLLDLAISGGRFHGGGIPFGIMVEIFGPSGSGKTVLLCELAGRTQAINGMVMFHDPESRLNKQFASLFGLDTDSAQVEYAIPDTIPEVFKSVRDWEPKRACNIICADSLAALSTDLEMENKDGDKMGMRRAKEFSEELRKTCRILTKKNFLLVCSNQVRVNQDAGPYGQKYISPGGEAIGFYASLRLRVSKPTKIKEEIKFAGKDIKRTVGTSVEIEVYKSSVWKGYRTAPITLSDDYGIDDIRENLKFIKKYSGQNFYTVNGEKMSNSLDESISMVESGNLESELKEEVIDRWEFIEGLFEKNRKPKVR